MMLLIKRPCGNAVALLSMEELFSRNAPDLAHEVHSDQSCNQPDHRPCKIQQEAIRAAPVRACVPSLLGQRDGPEWRRRWECVEALKEVMPFVASGVSALLLAPRATFQEPPTQGGASSSHPNGCNHDFKLLLCRRAEGPVIHRGIWGRADLLGKVTDQTGRPPGAQLPSEAKALGPLERFPFSVSCCFSSALFPPLVRGLSWH